MRVMGSTDSMPSFLACVFTFAHRARCSAAIFLRADADILCLGFALPICLFAALFVRTAFCAELVRRQAEADGVRLGFV